MTFSMMVQGYDCQRMMQEILCSDMKWRHLSILMSRDLQNTQISTVCPLGFILDSMFVKGLSGSNLDRSKYFSVKFRCFKFLTANIWSSAGHFQVGNIPQITSFHFAWHQLIRIWVKTYRKLKSTVPCR